MTALTATQIAKLNKMNRAAQDGTLGTRIDALETASVAGVTVLGASGSYSASATDASASRIVITTGLSAVKGFVANVRRSGSLLDMNAISGSVAGTLDIRNRTGGSVIAASDVVTWFAF